MGSNPGLSGARAHTPFTVMGWFLQRFPGQERRASRRMLSRRLFIFYAEDVMRNAGLEEAQAGIKIAGRNINNLRYADDTTVMTESKEELKSLLMKGKEES